MKPGSIAAVLASAVIGLPITIILLLGGGDSCHLADEPPPPSAAAQNAIPANYLALYQQAGAQYGLPWTLLAAIGSVETDHGRSTAPGVSSGVNAYGCCAGPMQFSVVGAGGGTWGSYGVDANHDGRTDVYDPRDAIPAAAHYLKASGAPADLHAAIRTYNDSEAYYQQVLSKMREYAAAAPGAAVPDVGEPTGSCGDLGGLTGAGSGAFTVAPDANLPDKPLTPALIAFITRMATFYDGTLIVTTGTNHDRYTTTGNVSDHSTGNAADFGMAANGGTNDGPVGDRIAAAAFLAAGVPHDQAVARAQAGGAQTIVSNSLRIQIIWKSDVGGNHHNHVHVGLGAAA